MKRETHDDNDHEYIIDIHNDDASSSSSSVSTDEETLDCDECKLNVEILMERETHNDNDHEYIINIHNDDASSSSSSVPTDEETSDSDESRLNVEILQDFVIMECETHNDNDHQYIIDIHNDDTSSSSSSVPTNEETSDSGESRSNEGGATAHHEYYPASASDESSSSCTIGLNSMEFVFTSVQIVAALVVWTLSKHEHPQAVLLALLIVYTCGCIIGTLLLSWRIYNQVEEYPGRRVDRVMEELKIGLECFFVLWFIWGIFWISFGNSSPSDAPNLFRLCITFIASSCIRFSIALLILCADSEGQGQGGGFVFQGPINDDSCCICLEKFGEKKRVVRKLKCSHVFHLDCIQAWLKVKSTCPLCQSPAG